MKELCEHCPLNWDIETRADTACPILGNKPTAPEYEVMRCVPIWRKDIIRKADK